MSKESLDYLKLCPNYYTNWEDGCCMENCTFNDLDECPIHYVKGLLEEKDDTIKILEKALELACEEIGRIEAKFGSVYIRANGYLVDYFKTEAKEMMKSE